MITINNISTQSDFTGNFGQNTYFIAQGDSLSVQDYLAVSLANQLIDIVAVEQGNDPTDPDVRAGLMAQILTIPDDQADTPSPLQEVIQTQQAVGISFNNLKRTMK